MTIQITGDASHLMVHVMEEDARDPASCRVTIRMSAALHAGEPLRRRLATVIDAWA